MTTKLVLFNDAYSELGLAGYVFDLSPEEEQEALRRANRMAAMWDSLLIRLGYSMGTDINAESGLPDTAEECFVLQLALRLAPTVGKTLSSESRVNARTALNALLAAQAKRPQQSYPARLPIGKGNRRGVLEKQYFPETTEVPGLNDGATEY